MLSEIEVLRYCTDADLEGPCCLILSCITGEGINTPHEVVMKLLSSGGQCASRFNCLSDHRTASERPSSHISPLSEFRRTRSTISLTLRKKNLRAPDPIRDFIVHLRISFYYSLTSSLGRSHYYSICQIGAFSPPKTRGISGEQSGDRPAEATSAKPSKSPFWRQMRQLCASGLAASGQVADSSNSFTSCGQEMLTERTRWNIYLNHNRISKEI